MTKLFTPFSIKDVVFKNRIVMSPMCMFSSFNRDGHVSKFHHMHYVSRAMGQVGLIMLESTAVHPQGRISMKDLGIWYEHHIEGLSELVQEIHRYGSKAGIQISHAGRKADIEGEIYAPSPLPYKQGQRVPNELSLSQIQEIIHQFKEAARRAKVAEFDVIELHGAHGYLINEFLSPLSNHRNDQYGGIIENRYRFLEEIIDVINEVWDGPLLVRLSVNEYHPEGNSLDDIVYFSKRLKEQGVDLIDCSSGAIVPARIDVFPGYQVPLAEKIRQDAGIATGAVGLITNAHHAEEILKNNRADLIFIARELLRNPYWPLKAAIELGIELTGPGQYSKAWEEAFPVIEKWYPN
ncbi:NADPH2 dehydrogenase [Neobacillus niacini]|uniref:NADPH dehydrogenase NamA n=1 Tax=Neobacillus niacini TaxID=86668 RepID=UPI0028606D63|nr:NADPH2 dehydrogenase [Neobacillus niacini]